MEIRNKREFFELWEAGVLGNKLRTWRTPTAAFESGVPIVGFRQIGVAGGGKLDIVKRDAIYPTAAAWEGVERRYMICEAAPDECGTIQGEICRHVGGLAGCLGFSPGLRMRDAIAQGLLKPISGLAAKLLIERYMDPSSQADLDALLELYPDAVVEFTCYTRKVGSIPGRNTIFWEVRNY